MLQVEIVSKAGEGGRGVEAALSPQGLGGGSKGDSPHEPQALVDLAGIALGQSPPAQPRRVPKPKHSFCAAFEQVDSTGAGGKPRGFQRLLQKKGGKKRGSCGNGENTRVGQPQPSHQALLGSYLGPCCAPASLHAVPPARLGGSLQSPFPVPEARPQPRLEPLPAVEESKLLAGAVRLAWGAQCCTRLLLSRGNHPAPPETGHCTGLEEHHQSPELL